MIEFAEFIPYLIVMAGVTYLVRMLPLVLVRKKFENRFVISFLYYVPYAVLGVMTVPAVFYSTNSILSASVGFVAALVMAYLDKSLITVAGTACGTVLICEILTKFL